MKEVIKFSGYTHRFLARFVREAETPLAVGSGEKDILTDALVATDVNGLPYIPGTAIAGVVRHMLEDVPNKETDEYGRSLIERLFGYQETKKQKETRKKAQKAKNEKVEDLGKGSEVIFTEAKILNSEGNVIDGMNLKAKEDLLLSHYDELPIRQHVRINDKGVTDKAGKFDEQVVFAGTRFCFELEMVAKGETIDNFNKILEQVQSQTFRIGGGTRSGFGKIKVVDLQTRHLDLANKDNNDLKLYLEKSSDLSKPWNGWTKQDVQGKDSKGWTTYKLILYPEDFFLFGSGFGDDEVDMTPVKEKKVVWDDDSHCHLSEDLVLIPAASVKGALAHRVAFHYNKMNHVYAEKFTTDEEREKVVGKNNEAVKALFGSEGEKDADNKMINQQRGNLLFSDVIEDKRLEDKILNHVAIDRFTGGAIDGALFQEKTTYITDDNKFFTLTILAKESALEGGNIQKSLEAAMEDICKGLLPLGGGVNRGNGAFSGTLLRGNDVIYPRKEA